MTDLDVAHTGDGAAEVPVPSILAGIDADLAGLDAEITEIDLLLQQARTEASRHEQRLEQAGERIAQVTSGRAVAMSEVTEAYQSLVTVTRKAGVMQASIDVLEGKRRILARFRDRLADLRGTLQEMGLPAAGTAAPGTAGLSRIVLTAQEDMRREIARAMHDGPAQSLTNIVLQAQIVQRLHGRDPEATSREIGELVRMVEKTLEATKTFIFDVRPMVLDDLGLMPTLRRDARERSRRSQVPIDFDSVGADRRLPIDVESTLFRMIDDVLAGFVAMGPEKVSMRLDWGIRLVAIVSTPYAPPAPSLEAGEVEPEVDSGAEGLPPALAAMMRQRVVDAAPRLRDPMETALPEGRWREVEQRAATIGADVSLDEAGHRARIAIDLPA